jgi:hypothetical protein
MVIHKQQLIYNDFHKYHIKMEEYDKIIKEVTTSQDCVWHCEILQIAVKIILTTLFCSHVDL